MVFFKVIANLQFGIKIIAKSILFLDLGSKGKLIKLTV